MNLGILILATNAFFPLGLRLINRFSRFYNGTANVRFYLVSDKNPSDFITEDVAYTWLEDSHSNWQDGTNSKFKNLLRLKEENLDYIFYMDADTNVNRLFDDTWMLGEVVGAEHFGNQDWMKDVKSFDRNPKSKAYVPFDTDLPQTYYHGAFFGGTKAKIMEMSEVLLEWQIEDKKIPYEPGVNDESYMNAYFHYNPPTSTIAYKDFQFTVSDGGGIEEKRDPNLNVQHLIDGARDNKNKLWDIQKNRIVVND